MAERNQRTPSGQIRSDVVTAALTILTGVGPGGLTVRSVTTEAHVAPMAIYNHFGSLNGLVEHIWIEGFELFDELLQIRTADSLADLFVAGRNYREFAHAHRGHYTVMFMHQFKSFEASTEAYVTSARAFDSLVTLVRRAQKDHFLIAGDTTDMAQNIWAVCHGFVALELTEMNFSHDASANYERLLHMAMNGLAPN